MHIFQKNLLGSSLEIGISHSSVDHSYIQEIFSLVQNFENKYSRFIDWNYLYQLNHTGQAPLDNDLKIMIQLARKAHELSDGYFDITVLPYLENNGYGIAKETMPENIGMQNVQIENNTIKLKNNIKIDLGGIGKGYMVDVIFDNLSKKYSDFIINFGGDIRVKGLKKEILLEDPLIPTKYIGKTYLHNLAIASSGGSKRKIYKGHHLINAKTGSSSEHISGVHVIHKYASFADTLATAMFVSPLEISLDLLKKTKGLEAMIITKDGKIYKSKNFNFIKHT